MGRIPEEEKEALLTFPAGLDLITRDIYPEDALCGHSSIRLLPGEVKTFLKRARKGIPGPEDRALGCLLGNAVGDALGAPFEFAPVRHTGGEATESAFQDGVLWTTPDYNRSRLRPGQWTDDFSMALCLAESLLVHGRLVPQDLRLRFQAWWSLGYCNAFAKDVDRLPRSSVGLGGNISESMEEFRRDRTEYTTSGGPETSGNGSIMRLSPVPVMYWRSPGEAMRVGFDQSRTTHQGVEAAEGCRLLAFLCAVAIQEGGGKTALERLTEFRSERYSIRCLAAAQKEELHPDNNGSELEDRDWRWRRKNHRFSPVRCRRNPGYVGSYCMDALAMALHCIWSTDSFTGAVLKSVNRRGDSDSVGAVTGQIAGAIYGYSAIPKDWLRSIEKWDGGDSAYRAHLLFHRLSKG